MTQIGRKIYYDKATGNVLATTPEMFGDIIESTTEQDFSAYVALQGRDPTTVGVLQLDYGQDSYKFGIYTYHIDPTTKQIVWGVQLGATLEQAQATKKQLLSEAIASKITAGYVSPVVVASTGKSYTYGTELVDQQNMTAARVWSDNNPTSIVKYRPLGGVGRIDHTRNEFVTISNAVFDRVNWYLDQADVYVPQIYAANATIDSVNSIVITINDPA
jgi:hypothetical protein